MANPSTHYSLADEIRSLAERGMVLYSQSYAKMRENELAIDYSCLVLNSFTQWRDQYT